MGRTLFILNTFNDIDHISPVIWKFIQKGEKPIVIFHSSYDYKKDYRIQFLQREGELEIYPMPDGKFERYRAELGSKKTNSLLERIRSKKAKWYLYRLRNRQSFFGKLYRRFRFDCSFEMDWLREKNISAAVFEWNTPAGSGEVLERIFYAAKGLGIPTFSIPHGCNIYLNSDINKIYRTNMVKGILPDFTDRNEFDHYVVQSRYHLEHFVRFGMHRSRIQAWGSVRFYPEWQQINLKLCGEFQPKKDVVNRLKVVFMLPHWNYNVHKQKTLKLLDEISQKDWVHLIIKDHTRGSTGLLPLKHQEKYDAKDNVEIDIDAHSPALIRWADVVINFGSSIGIEALLQDKTLIHPGYLHSNWTIFDETGAALLANDNTDVIGYLENLNEGVVLKISSNGIAAIYRSIIYGGNEPYDVLSYYYNQIVDKKK